MRKNPRIFTGANQVNYLCVAADLLSLDSLAPLPLLVSNYRSVLCHQLFRDQAIIAHNLRLLGVTPVSPRLLRMMVNRYNHHHSSASKEAGDPRHYRIRTDLSFEPAWGEGAPPKNIIAARAMLQGTLEPAAHNLTVADATRSATYRQNLGEITITPGIWPMASLPPAPPVHDTEREPVEINPIEWADLVAMAREFDAVDRASDRKVSWESRLIDHAAEGRPATVLKEVTGADRPLEDSDRLVLTGTKHLIGLPGAGKSTILHLVAAVLDARGHKAAFFLPSIDVANQFVETLGRYHVGAGLLFGQAKQSRPRHVSRLAQRLGRKNGGFAQTSPTARLFATNCALAGFVGDEGHAFRHDDPPCNKVYQTPEGAKRPRRHSCGLSGVCGRNLAQRELTSHRIWAGHVATTDTRIRPPYSDYNISYFELLARTFDLVVFDEADDAQQHLDDAGASTLQLWGTEGSVAQLINRDVQAIVAGGQGASPNDPEVASHLTYGSQFQSTSVWAHGVIASLNESYREEYANQLLTTSRLFSALFPPPARASEDDIQALQAKQYALETLWTLAAKALVFGHGRGKDDEDELGGDRADSGELAEYAHTLGIEKSDAEQFVSEIQRLLGVWDISDNQDAKNEASDQIARVLLDTRSSLLAQQEPDKFSCLVRLTIAVTLVVLRHMRIAPLLRYWVSIGYLSERTSQRRPSDDFTRVLPESLLGRLAGVRYRTDSWPHGAGGVTIDLVSFVATPRALLYRLSDLFAIEGRRGPAVLLTSATSFLEHSPSFHVCCGPDYLLSRPGAKEGWKKSRYLFLPLPDPMNTGESLQFSGTPQHRKQQVLTRMADELIRDGHRSVLSRNALKDVVYNIPRRSALVVNSYEQVSILVEHIVRNHPPLASKVRGVIDHLPAGASDHHYVTRSQVENLGNDQDWEVVVFAIGAIGRGVNIVFPDGPRKGKAMIGHLYFLTRPHPTTDSLDFLRGLAGRESMRFDQQDWRGLTTIGELQKAHAASRRKLAGRVDRLLRHPLIMRRLSDELMPWFVADQMIAIIQTIGRAMRNDSPAFVYFVDAAWAPGCARGQSDDARSSMLVMMRSILDELTNHEKTAYAEIYRELYAPFLTPLSKIPGVTQSTEGAMT